MDDKEFFEQLRSICADAIEAYRVEYPDAPRLTKSLLPDIDTSLASWADLQDCFDELTKFYDQLLDADSTPYRDTWRDHLVYDCSRRERLRILTSDLPESLSLVFIGGRYSGRTGWIGVSTSKLPEAAAYTYLASELCHAYQHRFDSPTWTHPYLQEGFEQAASIRAQAYLADEFQQDVLGHLAERQRVKTLLEGILAHGTRRGGVTAATVRELGVTDQELAELQSHPLKQALKSVRPRYQWSDVAFLPEYVLFGSMLLVSEKSDVSSTYAQAFHGNHPWTSVIDEITASKPSWLWRLYHK